jgi:hypothetical protein
MGHTPNTPTVRAFNAVMIQIAELILQADSLLESIESDGGAFDALAGTHIDMAAQAAKRHLEMAWTKMAKQN